MKYIDFHLSTHELIYELIVVFCRFELLLHARYFRGRQHAKYKYKMRIPSLLEAKQMMPVPRM